MGQKVEAVRQPSPSTDAVQASVVMFSDDSLVNPILEINKFVGDIYDQLDLPLDYDITQLILLDARVPVPPPGQSVYTFSVQFAKGGDSPIARFQPGPTGSIGFMGVFGYSGVSGPPGPTGPFGYVGFLGLRGPIGFTGPRGVQGVGLQGPPGIQGPVGGFGPAGLVGSTGPIGPTGAIGPVGPTGAIGTFGPTGIQGVTGTTGPQGATGVQGVTGPQGATGVVGPTGSQGPQGALASSRVTPLDAQHIHAWELTETSGTTFADTGSSSQKVNMTILNTSISLGTAGLFGPCPFFGLTTIPSIGANSASALVSSFNDLPGFSMTFECWVQQTSASASNGAAVISCDFSNSVNFQIIIGSTTNDFYTITWRISAGFGNGSVGSVGVSSSRMIGEWVHLAVTYDLSFFRMYVNGDVIKGDTGGGPGGILWTNTNGPAPRIYIGAQDGTNVPFVGKISRVRLSNVARSQAYITSVVNRGLLT